MVLGKLELLIADAPELSKLFFLLAVSIFRLLLALYLKRPAAFDRLIQFELAALLVLKEAVSLVLSLRHLTVKHRLIVVL